MLTLWARVPPCPPHLLTKKKKNPNFAKHLHNFRKGHFSRWLEQPCLFLLRNSELLLPISCSAARSLSGDALSLHVECSLCTLKRSICSEKGVTGLHCLDEANIHSSYVCILLWTLFSMKSLCRPIKSAPPHFKRKRLKQALYSFA